MTQPAPTDRPLDAASTQQVANLKLQIETLKANIDARKFGILPEEEHQGFGAWLTEEALLVALEEWLAKLVGEER